MPHRCTRYNKNAPTKGCDCEGCTKQREIARRSNRKTRPWNAAKPQTEGGVRYKVTNRILAPIDEYNKYLETKRKYKHMRDDSGLPRHICPNCVLKNEQIQQQIDSLQLEAEKQIEQIKSMLDRIPDNYPEASKFREQIDEIQKRSAKQAKQMSLTKVGISDVCHEPYSVQFLTSDNSLGYIFNLDDKGVQALKFLLSQANPIVSIQHKCEICKDPILGRPFIWLTSDRVISGYGDNDFTYLGTSSIDKKISNEEFIRRQVRYYHLTSYYKDCHSHEGGKVTEPQSVEDPSEDESDIGDI